MLHIVRNENAARLKADEGGFNVLLAGSTVQALAIKLAKACTDDVYEYYLAKIKRGSKFSAAFLNQRHALFSATFLLDHTDSKKKGVRLSGLFLQRPKEVRRRLTQQSNLTPIVA
jgi:hypothetical protein